MNSMFVFNYFIIFINAVNFVNFGDRRVVVYDCLCECVQLIRNTNLTDIKKLITIGGKDKERKENFRIINLIRDDTFYNFDIFHFLKLK